jgi:phage tail-like protein
MPRSILSDELKVHEFHLYDVDWSLSAPPFVFWPLAGFSSITMPEMTIETEEITEGTSNFVHHVLKKASMNALTLTKGVSIFNSDFWRWTVACLLGNNTKQGFAEFAAGLAKAAAFQGSPPVPGKRRNLMLVHSSGISAEGLMLAVARGNAADKLKAVALAPALAVSAALGKAEEGISKASGGMIELGISSVPGKMYMLFNCLPTRYKPGSDFNAEETAVSIEELDIIFENFEEMAPTA